MKGKIIVAIICALIIAAVMIIVPVQWNQHTCKYDVYYVTAPFGVYSVDSHGVFFIGSGTIHSDIQETYIVKYWKNGMLNSITFDASDVQIVIDGTLQIEQTWRLPVDVYGIEFSCAGATTSPITTFIHLPALPDQYTQNGTIGVMQP